jgi:SARP family transcriptional regulator, regulator of embCAB operon
VPRDEIAELLWGDLLPATWEKALRVLMTKLRALLEECGIDGSTALTSAFGCYKLSLPGVWIDVDAAREALERAEAELAVGDLVEARAQADVAAALARRVFLPGEDGPWVEEKRRNLHEVLVRAVECLRDASFCAGDFAEAVRHAQEVAELEPFRESGYRLLMEAHAAAGNPAEALRVYERCRRFLADELGAYPSPETEAAYLEILRADPMSPTRDRLPVTDTWLRGSAATESVPPVRPTPQRRRRRLALVVAAAALAAGTAASLAFLVGAGKSPGNRTPIRVALVVSRDPAAAPNDPVLASIEDGVHRAERDYGASVDNLVANEFDPSAPGVKRLLERLRSGSFGLVLVFGGLVEPLSSRASAFPSTHFAFFDRGRALPNATTFIFADDDAGYLAGYLSGLVEASHASRLNEQHVVSMIGGLRGVPSVEALLAGFAKGVHKALPNATVLRDYSQDFVDTSRCEAIANRQIDAGSDIVFAAAGRCSLGALSAASIRRVWAVGVDADQSYLGDHVLVSTVKRYDQAVFYAVRSFAQGTLRGGTVRLGLRDEAVGIVGVGPNVTEPIRRRVALLAWDMRRRDRQ